MRKYKQNTAESLNADNSIRFSEMTELSDSEVGKQKQLPHLPQCSHGKKKKERKKSQETLKRSKCISFLFCYVDYGMMQYQGTYQINTDLNANYIKIN